MKSAIIIVLVLALGTAAFFTRPSQADFKEYIAAQQSKGDSTIGKLIEQVKVDSLLSQCTFNDRLLWTDVQQNGKTIYTGAFGHWFNRAQVAGEVQNLEKKADSIKIGTH